MSALLMLVAVVVGLPGALAALHLTTLTVASLFYRPPRVAAVVPQARFCVLIPAHNEEDVIGSTLDSVNAVLRDGDWVLVVADGCSDTTAAVAAAHGAEVLDRGSARVAGRAAARQSGVDHALSREWDALVFIDADSRVEPGFLDACERALAATGAKALQARSEGGFGRGIVSQAYLAAFTLQGVVLPRGRDRLGLSVRLRGTGMVLRREIAEAYRFRAPASEDLWYSLDLCLDGTLPRHVDDARMRSASVRTWSAAAGQRLRYEAGRMSACREYLLPLLRRHSGASLEAAWFLATPPVAVAVASLLVATVLAGLAGAIVLALTGATLLAALGVDVAAGLVQARAGARTWLSLLAAPWYVPWKVWVQIRAFLSVHRRQRDYGPTPRS